MLCTNKQVNNIQHYHDQLIRACNQVVRVSIVCKLDTRTFNDVWHSVIDRIIINQLMVLIMALWGQQENSTG